MYKKIPKVDKVLDWQGVRELLRVHPRQVVVDAIRSAQESLRAATARGETDEGSFDENEIMQLILAELDRRRNPAIKRVINGTGVIIHTNLGRAPLSAAALDAVMETASGYCDLEFDLEKGTRGSRAGRIEEAFRRLLGTETAIVVNNNAAAVLLALSSLAVGREVIVSRGELVEIGGSFRIPDVMKQSGAFLREVGTTNRTHQRDYRSAMTPEVALLLKVHTSNFKVVGFTADVSVAELAAIGRESGVPVMVDAGSGNIVDLDPMGIQGEPTIRDYLAAGADLVTFSCDKLLGGPQAGVIVGRRAVVESMKSHPLYRALRVDKMTLAALDGTLRMYADERQALREIPVLRMLNLSADELTSRARSMVRRMRGKLNSGVSIRMISGMSQVGGGSVPGMGLPTTLLAVAVCGVSPQELDRRLRAACPPIVGRISQGEFVLDVRTLEFADIPALVSALDSIDTSPA